MNTTEKNGKIIIALEGRIDTNNAPDIEKELLEIYDANADKELAFDAEKLEYISSAGLRVLMKIRKKANKAIDVLNVSKNVYDIFETTGFTELLNVKKALREVSVEGCELIGSGGYGKVYRLDAETIIKVYVRGSLEMIEQERLMSQRAFVNGLPTAISYDVVKVGENYGVIYEMLNARTTAQLMTDDPDNYEKYVRLNAAGLKRFHTVELTDKLFKDKKQLFYDMVKNIGPYVTAEEIKLMNDYIDDIPDRRTFLHGDYNYKNVMIQDGEVMLIDIGDACVGHPAFDLAGVLLVRVFALSRTRPHEETVRLLGFDPSMAEKIWKAFCSEYFDTNEPGEIERYTQMLMPLALFTMAYHSTRVVASSDKETMKKRVDFLIRGKLLPSLKNAVKFDFKIKR